jgi:hypothetical protein
MAAVEDAPRGRQCRSPSRQAEPAVYRDGPVGETCCGTAELCEVGCCAGGDRGNRTKELQLGCLPIAPAPTLFEPTSCVSGALGHHLQAEFAITREQIGKLSSA